MMRTLISSRLALIIAIATICTIAFTASTPASAASSSSSLIAFTPDTLQKYPSSTPSIHLVAFITSDTSLPSYKTTIKPFLQQFTTFGEKTIKAKEYSTRVGTFDCKVYEKECASYNITSSSLPIIKLFSSHTKKIASYKPESSEEKYPTVQTLTNWYWKVYPMYVTQQTKKTASVDRSKVTRVILFTDKRETGTLWKTLAFRFAGSGQAAGDKSASPQVVFTEVRKSERALFDSYGVSTSSLPTIMIEPCNDPVIGEERGVRQYLGKKEFAGIEEWIRGFLPKQDGAEDESKKESENAATASASNAVSSIPTLADSSCYNHYCSFGLCIILFLSNSNPSLPTHLQTLHTIQSAAQKNKQLGKFTFVHADTDEWARANFDVDLEQNEYPQLVLVSNSKNRYARYIGAFSQESVLSFLKDITKGKEKTMEVRTKDKVISKMKEGNACEGVVKEAEAKRIKEEEERAAKKTKSSSSSSSSSSSNVKHVPSDPVSEEGKVHTVTNSNHASLILDSIRPRVLLFTASAALQDEKNNVTAEYLRVAKNMQEMLTYGTVDVSNEAETADVVKHWNVDVKNVPVVIGIPSIADPTPTNSVSFTLNADGTTTARALRDWSRTSLLLPASTSSVMHVTSQSMQQFMGDIQPGLPFSPKMIMFVKPDEKGEVQTPDMMRALGIEFGNKKIGDTLTIGLASSRDSALARQFNVTRIPAVFTMQQGADLPGQADQIRVEANAFGGKLTYPHLRQFCQYTLQQYQKQKEDWARRASKGGEKKQQKKAKKESKKKVEEEESINLDDANHDEL